MNWLVGMQRAQPVAWAVLAIALVTVAGFAARKMFGLDFTAITGLLAASITDPPVLAFHIR